MSNVASSSQETLCVQPNFTLLATLIEDIFTTPFLGEGEPTAQVKKRAKRVNTFFISFWYSAV